MPEKELMTLKQSPYDVDCWVITIPDYHGAYCEMKFFGLDAEPKAEARMNELIKELDTATADPKPSYHRFTGRS